MYDVFLSYKSERRPAVRHLAKVLELYGYTVWYDYKLLSGADFARQIESVLKQSKVVMPLWCDMSVESEWVLEEAHVAKQRGAILPVMIEQISLPFGFTRLDTVDLTDWDASPRSHKLDRLIDEVSRLTGKSPHINYDGLRSYEESWRNFGAPRLSQFALGETLREEKKQSGASAPPRQDRWAADPPPKAETSASPPPSAADQPAGTDTGKPDVADAFDNVFGDIFGGKPKAKSSRGSDLRYDLNISLEQAFHGDEADIPITRHVPCKICKGSGGVLKNGRAPKSQTCSNCDGKGRVRAKQGFFTVEHTCKTCDGKGQTVNDPCWSCNGQGRVEEKQTLRVKIPAGVRDGTRIRLSGQGEPGQDLPDAPATPGDLYVFLKIIPHDRFALSGDDLHIRLGISKDTAKKGGALELQTIEGKKLKIKIRPDTVSGQKLRLRDRGMIDLEGNRGDLYVELVI